MKRQSRTGAGCYNTRGGKNHKKLIVWMKGIKAATRRLQPSLVYKTARLCLSFGLKSEHIYFYR